MMSYAGSQWDRACSEAFLVMQDRGRSVARAREHADRQARRCGQYVLPGRGVGEDSDAASAAASYRGQSRFESGNLRVEGIALGGLRADRSEPRE